VPYVRSRDHDQQGRNPNGGEDVKDLGQLFVDQNEKNRR
jgi:hypothetical protein